MLLFCRIKLFSAAIYRTLVAEPGPVSSQLAEASAQLATLRKLKNRVGRG